MRQRLESNDTWESKLTTVYIMTQSQFYISTYHQAEGKVKKKKDWPINVISVLQCWVDAASH